MPILGMVRSMILRISCRRSAGQAWRHPCDGSALSNNATGFQVVHSLSSKGRICSPKLQSNVCPSKDWSSGLFTMNLRYNKNWDMVVFSFFLWIKGTWLKCLLLYRLCPPVLGQLPPICVLVFSLSSCLFPPNYEFFKSRTLFPLFFSSLFSP